MKTEREINEAIARHAREFLKSLPYPTAKPGALKRAMARIGATPLAKSGPPAITPLQAKAHHLVAERKRFRAGGMNALEAARLDALHHAFWSEVEDRRSRP